MPTFKSLETIMSERKVITVNTNNLKTTFTDVREITLTKLEVDTLVKNGVLIKLTPALPYDIEVVIKYEQE